MSPLKQVIRFRRLVVCACLVLSSQAGATDEEEPYRYARAMIECLRYGSSAHARWLEEQASQSDVDEQGVRFLELHARLRRATGSVVRYQASPDPLVRGSAIMLVATHRELLDLYEDREHALVLLAYGRLVPSRIEAITRDLLDNAAAIDAGWSGVPTTIEAATFALSAREARDEGDVRRLRLTEEQRARLVKRMSKRFPKILGLEHTGTTPDQSQPVNAAIMLLWSFLNETPAFAVSAN